MRKSLPLVDCYHRKESNCCILNNNLVDPNNNPNLMHHEKTENQTTIFKFNFTLTFIFLDQDTL